MPPQRRQKVRQNLYFDQALFNFYWGIKQALGFNVGKKGKGEVIERLMREELEYIANTNPSEYIRLAIKEFLSSNPTDTNSTEDKSE